MSNHSTSCIEASYCYRNQQDYTYPKRSRLFSLPPIGLGTWYCESLTSYLKRLSDAHNVSVTNLLHKVLLPENHSHISDMHPLWRSALHSINGASDMAETFVNLLENATERNLSSLTMLPIESIIGRSGRGVLSKQLKICPHCIHDFRHQDNVFIPLLWWVKVVHSCPVHSIPLLSTCPSCSKKLKTIPNQVPLGYCDKCGYFFGQECESVAKMPRATNENHVVGELIASFTNRSYFRKPFISGIKRMVNSKQANDRHAGKFIPVSKQHQLKQWMSGRNHPRLDDLIQLCIQQSLSLTSLLSGHILPTPNPIPQIIAIKSSIIVVTRN